MANPTCTAASVLTNYPCFNGYTLDAQHKLAYRIWYMVKQLAAIGGTDYSAVLTTTLLTDANSVFSTMNEDQREAAKVGIAYNNAVAAGATVSSDVSAVADSVSCLINSTPDQLQQMYLLLLCQLGRSKTYPQ